MKRNLFDGIPNVLAEEIFEPLLAGEAFRVERIVSQGHVSPPGFWYDLPENEWVLVLQGAAVLNLEIESGKCKEVELRKGDSLLISSHQRHRVVWTDEKCETIWLAIYFMDGESILDGDSAKEGVSPKVDDAV